MFIAFLVSTQTQGMRPGVIPYTGMVSAFTRIVQEEGIRGLYRFVLTIFVKIEVLNVIYVFPNLSLDCKL